MPSWTIRTATPEDAPTLVILIRELAEYERMLDEAVTDVEAIRTHLSGGDGRPQLEALLAEDETGSPLGFAIFFSNYSTFLSRWGIYLEDVFVRPEHRNRGVGFGLFKRVAEIGVARGARRMEWSVLNWNRLAIDFYERLGATPMDEWTTMRLSGDALETLGRRSL
jgi:GNAT superfamily N-acetyltransferase